MQVLWGEMLPYRYYHLLRLPGLLFQRATANPIQAGWTLPNPNLADFNDVFYEGNTLPIAWEGWPAGTIDAFLQGINFADLWITTFSYDQIPYTQLLTSNVDVSQAGSYNWLIDTSTQVLASTPRFVLRFMPPGDTYNSSLSRVPQLYSTGFLIVSGSSSSSKTSSSSSTSSLSSSSSSAASASSTSTLLTTISAPSVATSTRTSSSSSSADGTADSTSMATSSAGLSTGAKIGIGIACGIASIAALALVYTFGRYRRNMSFSRAAVAPYSHYPDSQMQQLAPTSPKELHAQMIVAELLDKDQRSYLAELPSK